MVSRIWESLGTFWGQYPHKELFTKLWECYLDVSNVVYKNQIKVHLSKYLNYISPVLVETANSHEVVFSGSDKNVITISGLISYEIDGGSGHTFYIPTLSGVETGEVLEHGVDYVIHNKKYLQFLNDPPLEYDEGNLDMDKRITLYAEETYRHNPVLWNVYAQGLGLEIKSLDREDYIPASVDTPLSGVDRVLAIAEHYRYLIWALCELKSCQPTVYNLKRAYGISRGLPFTYKAGVVDSVEGGIIKIGGDSYTLPDGATPSVGVLEEVPAFHLLTEGVTLLDDGGCVEFKCDPPVADLPHNNEFHNKYVSSLIPAGLIYKNSEAI